MAHHETSEATRAPLTDAEIRSRADELIASLTPAEKAGQLTQYFYFGGLPTPRPRRSGQPLPSTAAARGRGGARPAARSARCCSSPTRPRSTGCSGCAVEGNRHGIPAAVRLRRHPRPAHDLPGADRAWPRPGIPDAIEAGQAVAAREARAVGIHWTFAPMVDIARDPRWGRIVEGAGRGPVPRRRGRRRRRSAASRASGSARPSGVIAGPKHFAGYGAALGGRDYDEVEPVRLGAVERLPAAVPGGGRRRRRQHHDRLHGPQRHPGHRQPLAVHRRAARGAGASTGFVVSDANAVRNLRDPRLRRATWPTPAPGRSTPGSTWRWRSPTRRSRTCPRRSRPGRGRRGGARRRACAACSRRSCGWACSTTRTSTRTGRRDGAGRPGPPRGRPRRRRALGGAAAQRGRPAAARPDGARLDRGHRAAGRLAARHPRPVGASTSTSTRRSPCCDGHPRTGPATGCDGRATRRASGRRSGPSRRCSTCSAATRPVDPEGFDDDAEFARGRRSWPRDADVAVVVVGEWQNMIGEAASRSSPRAARASAGAAAGGRRDRHAGGAAGDERPAARPAVGRRARAGDPRHLVPGHARAARRWPTCCSATASPGGKLPFTWPRTGRPGAR